MKIKLSVIVPLGERSENFALDSLAQQDQQVNSIVEVGPNPSKNRNNGLKKAKTELIAFVNGHSIVPSNWSSKVLSFFSRHSDVDIVGGPQRNSLGESLFGKVCGYALGSVYGAAVVSKRYALAKTSFEADETYLTSANLICRKKVFSSVLFDENLWPGEDPKFISDAKKAGFKIAYVPEIYVFNKRRTNILSFSKQIFSYGRTRPKKEKLRETLKKPYFLVPTFFLCYLLLIPSLYFVSSYFLAPIFLYILLLVMFSIYESLKNNNFSAVFLLPLVFLIIHISYGAGFLYGLFNKNK